jgi:hypothetical protein
MTANESTLVVPREGNGPGLLLDAEWATWRVEKRKLFKPLS